MTMKTNGLIGGMSWESTAEYYRIINEQVARRLGELHSGRILLLSLDFQPIVQYQRDGDWPAAADALADAASRLETAGAEMILICTNTMHVVADRVQQAVKAPLLHIADATAEEIKRRGMTRVALLGTLFTMDQDFYKGKLTRSHGLDVIVPCDADRQIVHDVIFNELCHGQKHESSRAELLRIIDGLVSDGAEGIILGCTELPLLIRPEDTSATLLDTTEIHARAAVEAALA